jgi:hypothetical protein
MLNLATKLEAATLLGSNLGHVTGYPDILFSVYRRIPVSYQQAGSDLFQILTYATVVYILTHIL